MVGHLALKSLFFWGPYQSAVALPIVNASQGVVSMTTVAGVIEWVLLVGLLMMAWGGLRAHHLGLSWRSLRDALPVLLGVWAASQIVTLSIGWATGEATWQSGWIGSSWWLGQRIEAVVGSGLIEEVLYRGFFLTQLFGWLRSRTDRDRAILWAVAATSLYFGVNHIPAGLAAGLDAIAVMGYVGQVTLAGALFAILYLRTGNLFVAAGAHALLNDPIPLASTALDPSLVTHVAVAVLALSWPALATRLGRMFTVGTIEGSAAF